MICSVEYQRTDGSWYVGHAGVDLKDPETYASKTGARVQEARACPLCDNFHRPPYDGACLLAG